MFRSQRNADDVTFFVRRKQPKTDQGVNPLEPCSCGKQLPSHPLGVAVPLRRKRLAASAAGGATAFAQPKPVGAQYRTHSLRRQKRQAGQPPGIQQEEMKRPQPGIRLRRDSRSGRESPRLLPFPARFSFPCWPYRDGGLAALAPLRGAKAQRAAHKPAPLEAFSHGLGRGPQPAQGGRVSPEPATTSGGLG